MSWNDEWRPLLKRFADQSEQMPAPKTVYAAPKTPEQLAAMQAAEEAAARTGERLPEGIHLRTWEIPVDAIADTGLRAEMFHFIRAMYEFEMPDEREGVIVTRMHDGPYGDSVFKLFAWARAAMVEMVGEYAVALNPPTALTGSPDGTFEPHSDMFVPALLLNILNDTAPGHGLPCIMPMDRVWDVALNAGMPPEKVEELRGALVEAGECDMYENFNGIMYLDHPWTPAVTRAMFNACTFMSLDRGQGYFINDRKWLHGRTSLTKGVLPEGRLQHRLYRFVWNSETINAQAKKRRADWDTIGRTSLFCKVTPEFGPDLAHALVPAA